MCCTPFWGGSSQSDAEILPSSSRPVFLWVFRINNPPSGEMQSLISLNIDLKIIKYSFKTGGNFLVAFWPLQVARNVKLTGSKGIFSWLWWPRVPGVGSLAHVLAECCLPGSNPLNPGKRILAKIEGRYKSCCYIFYPASHIFTLVLPRQNSERSVVTGRTNWIF